MAYTSEIEKLERRWLENPKGRNFAPLADAYRKAGEVDRAVELCKSGLEMHPDYVSAHIVYGRCLIDKKDDGEAEQVFQKVLTLDPENIIALKVLADLADRNNRFDDAVQWLGRLLNADPMNGDAAEALTRAKGKAAVAVKATESLPAPAPAAAGDRPSQVGLIDLDAAMAEAPTTAMGKPEFEVERASAAHEAPLTSAKTPGAREPRQSHGVGDLEVFDGTVDLTSVAGTAAQADGIELAEEVEMAPEPVQVEGLARTQYEGSGMFQLEASEALPPEPPVQPPPVPPPADTDESSPSVDLPFIMPDDIETPVARHTPPPVPAASAEPRGDPVPPPARRQSTPAAARPSAPIPAAVALSDDDGAADTTALSQAEPVVTETMAELYLMQGHQEEALRVYRALLEQRPGDARLRERVATLSSRGGASSARRPPGRPAKAPGGSGQSAAAFLRSVLRGQVSSTPAAVPVTSPAPEPSVDEASTLEGAFAETPTESVPGAPTQPAGDSISLDAVFGDQGGRVSSQDLPAPSAAESPATANPPGGSGSGDEGGGSGGGGGGFSFDDFFGGQPPAGEKSGGSSPKARPSGRTTRLAEDEGDLDQFQSWLKGLKS